MKKLFIILVFLPLISLANESEVGVSAPIDLGDQASLQRGARAFVNNCLNCHSASYMRYNRLQDIGLTEKQIKDNLLFAGEKVGDPMKATMSKVDAKNWFGSAPPDLSVEVRARGADWVYAYLKSFYRDDTRSTGWNNLVFDKVAMPHVLYQLQGEQVLNAETHQLELAKPGELNPAEYDAYVADLTNYMAFMAEPSKLKRKYLGVAVLLFLSILLVLVVRLKKEFWKDIK